VCAYVRRVWEKKGDAVEDLHHKNVVYLNSLACFRLSCFVCARWFGEDSWAVEALPAANSGSDLPGGWVC